MAYEVVSARFNAAQAYAATATSQATAFVVALNSTVSGLQLPQFNFDTEWPEVPVVLTPAAVALTLPAVTFPTDDSGASPVAPDVSFVIDQAPVAPALESYTFVPALLNQVPVAPVVNEFLVLPADPGDWAPPATPAFLSVAIRAFNGVNTFDGLAGQLTALPTDLQLVPPAEYTAPEEFKYESAFLTALQGELRRRLAGGTGIAPAVEAQIWARAQSREAGVAEANLAEVMRNAETRGFALPSGAMAAQLREAQKTALGKYSELSVDIAVKQAELEQSNVKHAIEQGNALEGRLIEYSNSMMTRAFDAARYLADNAVAIYNAQVATYRANLEKYSTYAAAYRALIDGERAKVDLYAAEVGAERTKVEINRAMIEQQRAQIEIRSSDIALYRERLGAVQSVLALENLKVQAFGERVRAYSAGISAEAARVEVFTAQIRGNQVISETYKSGVDAYASKLRAVSDAAKTKAEIYDSTVRALTSRVQAYSTRVSAVAEQTRAAVSVEGLKLEQARLESTNVASNNQTQVERYRATVALYESNKTVAIQQAKLISDNYFALRSLVAEASKVAAQVNAQLAASAFGSIQANASIGGTSSMDVNYNYSGEVSSDVPPLAVI